MKNRLYRPGDTERELSAADRATTGPERYRSAYRRDYARLIHCPAFRRLQGKTQVFPGDESDFFRNRLTHSLEVAQIAKSIAYRLNDKKKFFRENPINPDIVEFAGLAHDLGHPPFGHNGEAALDKCMRAAGGFEGNAQTFRILTRLEKKEFKVGQRTQITDAGRDNRLGLNLTYRSLASIVKYNRVIPIVRHEEDKVVKGIYSSDAEILARTKKAVSPNAHDNGKFKTVECWIMDAADDIAYSTYDLEDTFKAGFLSPLTIVSSPVSLLRRVAAKASKEVGREVNVREVLRELIHLFEDVFREDATGIPKSRKASHQGAQFARAHRAAQYAQAASEFCANGYVRTKFTSDLVSEFIAGVDARVDKNKPELSEVFLVPETRLKVEILKHYTYEATIMSPRLRVSEQRGFDIVTRMFDKLDSEKGFLLLPDDCRELYEKLNDEAERKRVICDFIAGMTDRYAVEFYGRIFSEDPQSIFKPF